MVKKNSITVVPAPESPSEAISAATLILVREKNGGMETYLMRRRSRKGAFAGAFVFPGGVVEPSDSDPGLLARTRKPRGSNDFDSALFMAAIRETFEESGVLFADCGNDGAFLHRADVARGRMSFPDLAGAYDLSIRADELSPFGRWVTPLSEPRRFDARFFAARMPKGQEPVPDGDELVEGLWISPAEALSRQAEGGLPLFPPTLFTLWEIGQSPSFESLAEKAVGNDLGPVLPQPFYSGDSMGVLLPHDPEYGIDDFRQEARPGKPSRVVARRGVWELL
ncbi:MAG: NUDIX domain-containing protein [Deltaproteobacteria bacterium]|nr:NUDIX domain-containing protein [Deltaproteobacteria bacterium]